MEDDIKHEETTLQKRRPKGGVKVDLQAYLMDQYKDAYSIVNIHGTCIEHSCTLEYALEHPELLLDHYDRFGGSENYAKYRSQYEKLCDYAETCPFREDCELALVQTDFKKCPLWKMSKGRCSGCCPAETTLPSNIIFPEEFACAI
jgi:hypothetical protein